jgi:L-2-hydroxyglutarate oxidase
VSPTAGRVDAVVVGGGIVGLATARALLRERPGLDLVLLERDDVAAHQSGHNSGVIHSGLYYRPDSAKARLCATGRAEMEQYCTAAGIPWERCGKVVVASRPDEVPALAALADRGRSNGLEVEELSAAGLAEHEPHAVGLASVFVPATGIVDYGTVCRRLAEEIVGRGGRILTGVGVASAIDTGPAAVVRSDVGLWWADRAVTCAGAWSDVLAEAAGERPSARIIPFRGEYLELTPEASHLVNHLIYPVPDARFPFLGVHFTRGIDGRVHAGPNAVPAFGRDAYSWRRFRPVDTARFAARPSSWRLAAEHWRTGADEIVRSLVPSKMVAALQRLVPEVGRHDLVPGGAGVRAQAINPDGTLLDDFEIVRRGRCVHVVNAPSPAATASLAIGAWIAREAGARGLYSGGSSPFGPADPSAPADAIAESAD